MGEEDGKHEIVGLGLARWMKSRSWFVCGGRINDMSHRQLYEPEKMKGAKMASIHEYFKKFVSRQKKDGAAIPSVKASGTGPVGATAWYKKGCSFASRGRYVEEIECYDKALEINPRYVDAWYDKGCSLMSSLGRFEEAIDSFNKVLEINPRDSQAWCNKGASLKSLGRYDEAMGCLKKALEIDPTDSIALANMAQLEAELPRKKNPTPAQPSLQRYPKDPCSSVSGMHPDSALPTNGLVQLDRSNIVDQYACPFCSLKGNKDILGHARCVRKTPDMRVSSYDVYTVVCPCGRKLAVWSEDASPDTGRRIAESVCRPNGKFYLAVGSGELPPIDPCLLDQ